MKRLFAFIVGVIICCPFALSQEQYLSKDIKMSEPSNGYPLPSLYIRNGLPNVLKKLKSDKPVCIAYFGGSITNHNGYRVYNTEWFKAQYPKCQITSINAGVGGTGSDLGVFRLRDDVLKYNPDLVFVEFAVNDGNGDSTKISNSMEGIVRQIKKNNPQTDICFLYTINVPMLNDMEQGKLFKSVRLMEHIANYYQMPSINFGVEVIKLLQSGRLIFKGEKGVNYDGKIVFTEDNTHPTFSQGHHLYNEILTKCIDEIRNSKINVREIPQKPLYKDNYENAMMISPEEFTKSAGWKNLDSTHPLYNMNKSRCPNLIYTSNPDDYITIPFTGRIMGVYDIIGPNSCGFTAEIDHHEKVDIQRFDVYCHYYRNNYVLLPAMKEGHHEITLRMTKKSINKEEIVSKRFKDKITDNIRNEFQNNVLYIGKILIIGSK
jgi:hypothetical protein